jgi:TolA-binding protein
MEVTQLLLFVALLVAVVGAGVAFAAHRDLRTERARVTVLQNDVRALCTAAVNVGERINQLEQRLRQLSLRQDELGMQQNHTEGDMRSFVQATKMVRKGASVDELVEMCGLSRGEAELIAMMQRLEKK